MAALLAVWCAPVLAQEGLGVARGIGTSSGDRLAEATVVVYNSADPSSEALAKLYARTRRIPLRHLIGLELSTLEEISRAEFHRTLAEPLAAELDALGLVSYRERSASRTRVVTGVKVRFVALMRGVPLKIARLPQPAPLPDAPPPASPFVGLNEASVDSELACLLAKLPELDGPVNNPYYNGYTSIFEARNIPTLLVCRLDARLGKTVMNMIKDPITAERAGQLWGRAWLDSRGIKEGGYSMGDEWLRKAKADLRRAGVPLVWDEREAIFPPGYPAQDVAIYLGWYDHNAGSPWADEGFRFRTGAVAAHIHSYSASTLRTPGAGWTNSLLESGASVSIGNVYEPFLHLTTNLDIFVRRLMEGYTFAEAFYMAQPALSWMAVALGDPLYRPFPKEDLDDLLAGEKATSSDEIWVTLRKLEKAWNKKGADSMANWADAAEAVGSREKGLIWEALAIRQGEDGDAAGALESIAKAAQAYKDPPDRARGVILRSQFLVAAGRKAEAVKLLKEKIADAEYARQVAAYTFYLHELEPPPPPPPAAEPK